MVAHASRGQRKDRMSRFEGRNWGNVPRAESRLRGGLQVSLALRLGAARRAGVARVGAGSHMAGVGQLSAVHPGFRRIRVFFDSTVGAAVRASLFGVPRFAVRVEGLGLCGGGMALSVGLALSEQGGRAGAR